MNLFICSSTYQLTNAIMIAKRLKNRSDILMHKNSQDLILLSSLANEHVFDNIYVWDRGIDKLCMDSRNNLNYYINFLKKAKMYFFPGQLEKTMPEINKSYKKIFVSYVDFPNKVAYYHFKKKCGAELYIYEDGTYTYECLNVKENSARRLYSKLYFNTGSILSMTKGVYVHKPKEVRFPEGMNVKVHSISMPDESETLLLEKIFNIDEKSKQILSRKYILFDQNLEYQSVIEKQSEIAYTVCQACGKENVCIKLHPATTNNNYSELNVYSGKIPFELFLETCVNDNSVLISVFSTACLNPKWLFDKEPYVIFTYKITEFEKVEYFDASYLNLVDKLKKTYRNKNKVFVPETIEELKHILEIIEKDSSGK